MKFIHLPVEPIDTRYSEQWLRWFDSYFRYHKIIRKDYTLIHPLIPIPTPSSTNFLHPTGTMLYKSVQLVDTYSQLMKYEGKVKVFLGDLWFPGAEGLNYLTGMTQGKIDLTLYGILHAGSYDPSDLTAMNGLAWWAKDMEQSIFKVTKYIFVGSNYHRNMIINKFWYNVPDIAKKLIVTGMPTHAKFLSEYNIFLADANPNKKSGITFTGRTSYDKGYDIVKKLRKRGFDIYSTMENRLPKDIYYSKLLESKVVFIPSRHENFGQGAVEGMALGCVPIVPDGICFDEYIPDECRYHNEKEMLKLLRNPPEFTRKELYNMVAKFDREVVIENMIKWVMK